MPTDNGTVHQAVCIQQQQIGEIKASLQTRKEENQEIKGQISTLINMLTTSQLDQTKRDSELKSELTKIATVLGNEREQRKVYEQQQAEQRLNLEQLQKDILEINANVKSIMSSNGESNELHKQFDARIRKLEHVAIAVYVTGVVIAGMVVAIIYVTQAVTGLRDVISAEGTFPPPQDKYQQIQRVEDHSTSTTTTTTNQRK